jgi:hypothetical protein
MTEDITAPIDELEGRSDCPSCDGFGIMVLQTFKTDGSLHEMECPCLECSADKNINELLEKRNKAILKWHKTKEKKLIDKHNERVLKGKV